MPGKNEEMLLGSFFHSFHNLLSRATGSMAAAWPEVALSPLGLTPMGDMAIQHKSLRGSEGSDEGWGPGSEERMWPEEERGPRPESDISSMNRS